MPVIEIVAEGRHFRVESIEPASNVWEVLNRYKIAPELGCGRTGRCGRCRVLAWGELSPVSPGERECLGEKALSEGWRLACLTSIQGNARIIVTAAGEPSVLIESVPLARRRTQWQPRDGVGVAVDLGTTTLAIQAIDGQTGKVLASRGILNPQTVIGPDVISRIAYADHPEGCKELTALLRTGVSRLIESILEDEGIARSAVKSLVCVGNSVMDHLFLGITPSSLGRSPFQPARTEAVTLTAAELDLPLAAGTKVYLPPLIGGFVGSDAAAAALASDFGQQRENRLLLDLGTNGELVFEDSGRTWCCSTAAGPAFEAGAIRDGMRAATGALVDWRVCDNAIVYQTIDDAPPRGIAGSCLLRVIAELRKLQVIRDNGRFESLSLWPENLQANYRNEYGIGEFRLVPGESLGLTQKDIREFQLAKGAIWAAVRGLLRSAQVPPEKVRAVILAGALGANVNSGDLISLGVLPHALEGKLTAIGNGALAGAVQLICHPENRCAVESWVKQVEFLELAGDPMFEEDFLLGMKL